MTSAVAKSFVGAAILLACAALTAYLILTRETPERRPPTKRGTLVECVVVERKNHRLDLWGQGTVQAAEEVSLFPQVRGVIVQLSTNLMPGGRVQQGETLFQIEPRDFEIAVAHAQAALQQAEARFQLEQGSQRIAQEEWALFEPVVDPPKTDASLALRLPQLAAAGAEVQAAQARLDEARLALSRTTITAPFDGLILSESVQLGQFVTPQTRTLNLIGTRNAWVRLSIPAHQVAYIDIPTINSDRGSEVVITYDAEVGKVLYHGRVIRLLGRLDPAGRLAWVLVEVPRPFALPEPSDGSTAVISAPLLVDAYVEGRIFGNRTRDWIEVSRQALHDGDHVHLITTTNTLEVRPVEIAWRKAQSVLVRHGLSSGDKVITTRLSAPVPGMKLRLVDDAEQQNPAPSGLQGSGRRVAVEEQPTLAAPRRGDDD